MDNKLRELQLKSLEILLYFEDFCHKEGLTFYLCGGCCIGAVRHKGFIPWDDDIDVFMPRKDYEKLYQIWNQKNDINKYKLNRTDENNYILNLLTYISDENTTYIKSQREHLNISHGIRIEILPLDGCPKNKWKRKMQLFWAMVFTLYNEQIAPTDRGKIINMVGKFLLFIVPTRYLKVKVWRFAEKQMSKYPIEECEKITELCARFKYMRNEYPKETFGVPVYKMFEGHLLPLPHDYHTYLSMAFGDYMRLPNVKDQKPKHDAIFIDFNESYKKYRGIKY